MSLIFGHKKKPIQETQIKPKSLHSKEQKEPAS